ncbi:MAG: hypothetical protein ACLQVG_17830 [Terriglobia bacterium]
MITVTGIFKSASDAQRAALRLQSLVNRDRITVLRPGEKEAPPRTVAVIAAEQPGMGKAIGGVAGAAVGIAGGVEVAAAVTATVPGVGPVIALGMLGGALLGFFGAKAGEAIDRAASEGLPEDEFFVYEDALRRGRSVLIASPADEAAASAIRTILEGEGAEAVDAAREMWWIGLRSAEEEHYTQSGAKFDADEKFYRLGFEAALHAKYRCKEYDQILSEMQADLEEVQRRNPGSDVEKPFLKGFERGRAHYGELCKKVPQ